MSNIQHSISNDEGKKMKGTIHRLRRWLRQTKAKGFFIICENLRHLRISYLMRGGFFVGRVTPLGRNQAPLAKGKQQLKNCSYEPRRDLTGAF
jgi:hypothetical protein